MIKIKYCEENLDTFDSNIIAFFSKFRSTKPKERRQAI